MRIETEGEEKPWRNDHENQSGNENGAKRLGWEKLKKEQIQPIQALMKRRGCLTVYPTGYGKSAIYQLPTLCQMSGRWTLVIEPTLALVYDQVRHLRTHGLSPPFRQLDFLQQCAGPRSTSASSRMLKEFPVMVIAGLRRSLRASTAVCTRPPSSPNMLTATAVPAFMVRSLNICPIPLEATAFISLFAAWVSPPPAWFSAWEIASSVFPTARVTASRLRAILS